MITISCSLLEQVKQNPTIFAEFIASGDKPRRGGTHGMFAYWQDIAKLIHKSKFDLNQGIQELQLLFFRKFDDTSKNRKKQSLLLSKLPKYIEVYKHKKFSFLESSHRIKWKITDDVMLTGLTPWVVKDEDDNYYAYFCQEKSFDWQKELKYPLLQKYIASEIIKCKPEKLKIGVYNSENNDFEFKSFTNSEIRQAISEAKILFEKVFREYKKLALVSNKN